MGFCLFERLSPWNFLIFKASFLIFLLNAWALSFVKKKKLKQCNHSKDKWYQHYAFVSIKDVVNLNSIKSFNQKFEFSYIYFERKINLTLYWRNKIHIDALYVDIYTGTSSIFLVLIELLCLYLNKTLLCRTEYK